ncbi:ferredoxin, partial [Fischerella thermalis CCMEE 5328]
YWETWFNFYSQRFSDQLQKRQHQVA